MNILCFRIFALNLELLPPPMQLGLALYREHSEKGQSTMGSQKKAQCTECTDPSPRSMSSHLGTESAELPLSPPTPGRKEELRSLKKNPLLLQSCTLLLKLFAFGCVLARLHMQTASRAPGRSAFTLPSQKPRQGFFQTRSGGFILPCRRKC